jgi:dTDP-4-amino-4,6-dideoxygalactose transaminase
VNAIEQLAKKHNLKVIYDAAHAFGVQVDGKGILNYGDISTLSFHATKLFHTIEGGGIATNDDFIAHRISFMRNFGHKGQEDFWGLGINGKNSEVHAAMGLCIYPRINDILEKRKKLFELYNIHIASLGINVKRPLVPSGVLYNHAYYPVVFESEKQLLSVRDSLNAAYIYPRRYFYPSLHQLPYIEGKPSLPFSESLSSRVLCLPLYHDLAEEEVKRICMIISEVLKY